MPSADNALMRRFHVPRAEPGVLVLDRRQAHHARDVLRLTIGDAVEVFDDDGRRAQGRILRCSPREVVVEIGEALAAAPSPLEVIVAAAVPKGARADWMVEKLGELGVSEYVPLIAARSVVHVEGPSKLDRWQRIAQESARQSRRPGVMRIASPAPLVTALDSARGAGWYFCTEGPSLRPMADAVASVVTAPRPPQLWLWIGPEGGWTPQERDRFERAGLTPVSLGGTILRVETAAVAAAAVVAAVLVPAMQKGQQT